MAHLNYDGLKRYDKKTKEYINDKIKNIKDIDVDKLATKDDLDTKADKTELFSGDYNDLTNLPVIPDSSSFATKTEVVTHTDDANIHITSDERTKWNAKLDNSALTPYATKTYVTDEVNKATSGITVDLTPYAKKVDVNASLNNKVNKVVGKSLIDDAEIARLATINNYDDTDIKNTINNKANTTDLTAHTSDTDIHVTSNEKTKWDSKLDSNALTGYATETFVTTKIAEATTSGLNWLCKNC